MRRTIRHRPFGTGHPYAVDTAAREPAIPVVGEPLRLGVTASDGIIGVVAELEADGVVSRVPLERVVQTSRGRAVDGGHLAAAAAKQRRAAGGWSATFTPQPDLQRYRFVGEAADGEATTTGWFDVRPARWRAGSLTEIGRSRIVDGSVQVLDDGAAIHRVRFQLVLAPGEHVLGFGERFDRVDQTGRALDVMVFEQYKSQGAEGKTYLPMPFAHVVGGDGWGFHLRTTARSWFDVGGTDASVMSVEVETELPSGAASALEIECFDGTPTEVLDRFLESVGRPEELPEWVLGLWASGNEWNTQAEVERQAALHREHGIPISAMVIEAWSDESTFTAFRDGRSAVREHGRPARLADFAFPAEGAWPDPKAMVEGLRADGVRTILWQIPLMKMRPHPVGQARADAEAARGADVLIQEPGARGLVPYRNRGWWFPLSLMPDLSDERAARWWTDQRRYLVDEVGIDGFKTDGGEHAWGRELRYRSGATGVHGNNAYPVAYAKAYGDLLRSAGKAPVTFSRAGWAGSQAHGAVWAGDENSTWEAFRWSMIAGLNASACGFTYWGWDIAGFSGDIPTAELYLRAMAVSAFVPIMQYHSEFNHHRSPSRDRTPWNIAERTGHDEVIPLTREIVALRERLRPYLADAVRQSIATGAPVMRPMWFSWPSLVAEAERIQWQCGDDLIVAPVLEPGGTSVEVRVPEDGWVDAWSGQAVPAGLTQLHAPLGRTPVLVRADAEVRDAFLVD
ncbi:glycoside hydrolase family 31 protein [Agrococcus sp. Marseille-P2731]|uniref:glycoside hydrolase family 31 protein n=1 Tax=Agrococcus sp. Marseille-P2731 TaxID=1841862 RepID=UPI0009302B87|nr:TIM-barrel domain-containing protein [Agrococcus sp. Marseille-P2731]